jgi:hypothetical protein
VSVPRTAGGDDLRGRVSLIGMPNVKDPMGYDADGYNLYQYVQSNPVGFTDPRGLETTVIEPPVEPVNPTEWWPRWEPVGKPSPPETGFGGGIGIFVFLDTVFGHGASTCGCDDDLRPEPRTNRPPLEMQCTQEEHNRLQAIVNARCKGIGGPRRCNVNMSVAELLMNAAKFRACAQARDAINIFCYGGGDAGHNMQAENMRKGAQRCIDIAEGKLH